MAKMYGKFSPQIQNSRGWTKASMRRDEERQIAKDVESEQLVMGDCPHVTSVREDIAGLKACHECWCLARGLNPETTEDYEVG
jgi:hypothetical protein